MSQLSSGLGGSFAPFSGQPGVPLSAASPFPMAQTGPGAFPMAQSGSAPGYGGVGLDESTYADYDFVVPKRNRPSARTVGLLVVLLLVAVGAGLRYTVFKAHGSSAGAPSPLSRATVTTGVPPVFQSASTYAGSQYFSAKFPSQPSVQQTTSTVVDSMPSTTYQAAATIGGDSYKYEVIVINLPTQMTAQGGAFGGGRYTALSMIQGLEPNGDQNSLQHSSISNAGPGGAWIRGDFIIQSSPGQYRVGEVLIVGTVGFVVDVQGPTVQPPGYDYFVSSFQPGPAATSTLQAAATTSTPSTAAG